MYLEEKFITTRLTNFLQYFYDIFFITLIIQIFSIPILMNSFQTFSIIAFVANLIAIPLVSFFIMPITILIIFLMIINAHNLLFWSLNYLLDFFIKIVNYFANFKYAVLETLPLSSFAVAICFGMIAIFFISENKWLKIFSLIFFVIFIGLGIEKKNPQIIIEKNQKLIAI